MYHIYHIYPKKSCTFCLHAYLRLAFVETSPWIEEAIPVSYPQSQYDTCGM